jgi:hypothetical protein
MSRDLYIKAKPPISTLIADMFEGRVIADGGTFEAKSCLLTFLNTIL